jgi:hypothetical protein
VTHELDELLERVRTLASKFARGTREQALTYACEHLADELIGARVLDAAEAERLMEHICHAEDLDVPRLEFARRRTTAQASTFIDDNTICIFGRQTTLSTLLHEIAHTSVRTDSHGVLFRDELVRLTRLHLSVEYAALLHSLFVGLDLEAAPWPASAHRR